MRPACGEPGREKSMGCCASVQGAQAACLIWNTGWFHAGLVHFIQPTIGMLMKRDADATYKNCFHAVEFEPEPEVLSSAAWDFDSVR